MNMRKIFSLVLVLFLVFSLAACGSKEEKRMKFYNRGVELFEKGDYVKARLEFQNAIQIDKDFAGAYLMLGKTALKDGNFQGAFGSYAKAVALDPELLDAQLELGKLFLLGKALDKATEKADLVLGKAPTNEEAVLLKASILLAAKDYGNAKGLLAGLLERGVKKPEVFILLAQARPFSQNDNDPELAAAEKILQDGIQVNQESVELHFILAKLYATTKRTDAAAGMLRKVIALAPDKVAYKLALADLYWGSGKESEASETLKAAIQADPANDDVRIRCASFLVSKQQGEKAEALLDEGIKQNAKSFKLRFALSELRAARHDLDGAKALLKECLTLEKDPAHPGIIEAKNRLGKMLFVLGEIDQAQSLVAEVLKENPKSIEAHFLKGGIHLRRGEGENAVAEFRTVVQERPQFEDGYLNLADAHTMNKQPELVFDTLKQGLVNNPGSKTLRKALAQKFFLKKDFVAAEANLRKILELDPKDVNVHGDLGDLFGSMGDFAKAEKEFATIKEKTSGAPIAFMKLADLFERQGQKDKALRELRAGYEKNPQSAEIMAQLVQYHVKQGEVGAAIKICQERIQKDPKDAVAHNLLGRVYLADKKYAEAEASLQKAMDLNPTWPRPYENMASMYVMQGQRTKAIERFETLLQKQPDAINAYLSLGLLYEMGQEYPKAIQAYETALAKDPRFWAAANNLAFLLTEKGAGEADLKRALQLALDVQKLQGDRPEIIDTLGWIYYKMGDVDRAAELLEKAVGDATPTPVVNYHLGMLRLKQGKTDEAKQKLQAALADKTAFLGREEAEAALGKI